ncbi:OLC1v1000938C1 [Oldenlandia corymbosa var. corymbosa]|uniref:OLC1v1000938C1 n=1 Tax=Oldenlandia corymbosa var. corymbosa TaxID=529605 RepID=A0AAV1D6N8_OLDCO|nr:OLC1v1000938C1 [Oldenlandia corymbosa var. corymbosa]
MAGSSPPVAPSEPPRSFASFFQKPFNVVDNKDSLIKPIKFINDTPTLEYEEDEFERLVAPHRLCLVGKFSYGRPKMDEIHKEFKKIGFNGAYTLGLMNPRHVLIRFEQEDDYQRCWIRTFWNIGGFSVRILKWTPGFRFEEDPPVVPIWVSLFDLPIEYMHPEVIYSMATALGQPLKVDTPTLNMTRPSVARFCVGVDLTKELVKSVKIGKKGRKHEQFFTFEHVPFYCQKCCKIGHKESDCRMGKPSQKNPLVRPTESTEAGGKKQDLEVEIVNLNPLIVKSNATTLQSTETITPQLPAKTLAPQLPPKTLMPREPATSSGLSVHDKALIPVDLQESPVPNVGKIVTEKLTTTTTGSLNLITVAQPSNPFSVLRNLGNDDTAMIEDSEEEEHMSLVPKPMGEMLCEDSVTGTVSEDDEEESAAEEFSWSKGERDGAHVERSETVSFLVLLEPMLPSNELEVIRRQLRFDYDFSSSSRKIWVLCKKGIRMTLLGGSEQALHLEIEHQSLNLVTLVSAVYAKSTRVARRELWTELQGFRHHHPDSLWLVGGDFNIIHSLDEYSGVSVQDQEAIDEFNSFIEASSLTELLAVGEDFTWGVKVRGLLLIKHVLSAIPIHVFAAIEPPKSILNAIAHRCQRFYGKEWKVMEKNTGDPGTGLPTQCWKMVLDCAIFKRFCKPFPLKYGGRLNISKAFGQISCSLHRILRGKELLGAGLPKLIILHHLFQRCWCIREIVASGLINGQVWAVYGTSRIRNLQCQILQSGSFSQWKIFTYKRFGDDWRIELFMSWRKWIYPSMRGKTSSSGSRPHWEYSQSSPNMKHCGGGKLKTLACGMYGINSFLCASPSSCGSLVIHFSLLRRIYVEWAYTCNHQFAGSVAHGSSLGEYLNSWWISGNFKTAIGVIKNVLPSFIVWELWKVRNKFFFENVDSTFSGVVKAVKEHLHGMMLVHRLKARNVVERESLQLIFPNTPFCLKQKKVRKVSWQQQRKHVLNTDGSSNSQAAGYGFVIRGEKGFFLYGEAGFLGSGDSLQAEVYGLLFGVRKCEHLDLFQVEVQTDNQFLANILATGGPCPWRFYFELREIRAILERRDYSIHHIYREANAVADSLARCASDEVSAEFFSLGDLPNFTRGLITLDQQSMPYVRVR